MYFTLSKIFLFLILPINWIFAFAILALIVKNKERKRKYVWISVILFLIFTNPLLLNRLSRLWHVPSDPLSSQKTYSCAIVLGGFAGEKLSAGEGFFNGASDRYIQAVRLKSIGKVSHLLISGGDGALIKESNFIESVWVKSQLMELGFPDSSVLVETRSRNTYENASYSEPVLKKSGLKPPYVLITSAVHMRRALMIFEKRGIHVVPYSCNYIVGIDRFAFREFVPDADVLAEWNYYIKEVVGYLVTSIRSFFHMS